MNLNWALKMTSQLKDKLDLQEEDKTIDDYPNTTENPVIPESTDDEVTEENLAKIIRKMIKLSSLP